MPKTCAGQWLLRMFLVLFVQELSQFFPNPDPYFKNHQYETPPPSGSIAHKYYTSYRAHHLVGSRCIGTAKWLVYCYSFVMYQDNYFYI